MFDRLDHWIIQFLKRTFSRGGSPERLGRGVAAGFVGAFFSLSILRFPATILAAFFLRGNRAVALLPPLAVCILEPVFLTAIPCRFAGMLWPRNADNFSHVGAEILSANESWLWLHPLDSIAQQWAVIAAPGNAPLFGVLGGAGILLGAFFGVCSYPFTVVFMSYFYDAKIRAKQFMQLEGTPGEARPFALPAIPARGAADVSELLQLYCGERVTFSVAAHVRLLENGGQAYPEMLAAIVGARESVDLETYIFRADKFGMFFAEALKDAARRGVKIRVVVDGFGSMSLDERFYSDCADAGVAFRVFHSMRSIWRGGFGFLDRRDHRKILIVDGRVSLTGGLNIGDEYAPVNDGGGGWQDMHVRIDGEEIAAQLKLIFEEGWAKAEAAPVRKHTTPSEPGGAQIRAELQQYLGRNNTAARIARFSTDGVPTRVISNRELFERMRIKRAYLQAIRAARSFILIENAFFIPDRDVLRALYKAARRGVAVGVVVAMKGDVQIAAMASRALYDELLARGIRIFEYRQTMVHAKVAVIDTHWAIVSSYNLNQRSLVHDLEAGALFFDEPFAAAVRDRWLNVIGQCNEVTLQLHRSRPWSTALLESLCYLFRYWL